MPLPKSLSGPEVPLPPEKDTLINPNYQLAVPERQRSPRAEETEEDEEGAGPNPSHNPSHDQTDLPQDTPQRVSFPLVTKDPK